MIDTLFDVATQILIGAGFTLGAFLSVALLLFIYHIGKDRGRTFRRYPRDRVIWYAGAGTLIAAVALFIGTDIHTDYSIAVASAIFCTLYGALIIGLQAGDR